MSSHKRKRRCHTCGERDRHLVSVTVMVDGRRVYRWRLCRACSAVKQVLLAAGEKKKC